MADTGRLNLPLLDPAQAQKHVTVNEALLRLDAMVQLVVQSTTTNVPPGVLVEGACYAVPPGAVNEWTGQAGTIAIAIGGAWVFAPIATGYRAYVTDLASFATYDGTSWIVGAQALSPHGAAFVSEVIEIDHVISAGATSDVIGALPANAIVYGLTGRVIDAISGTLTSFRIGVAGSDDRYGSGIGLAQGSWLRGLTGSPLTYYGTTDLRLSGEGGTFASGTLRIAVHLARLTLPSE